MASPETEAHQRRIYPLDAHELSEEQIAVTFAMTSRRPEPFDEIARQVSQEKAADFHERWVLGYGHASVAEHAVVHLAVENISRLACDTLEDNRLASYTEKSSRYQVMPPDYFYSPKELDDSPALGALYRDTCSHLFQTYFRFIDASMDYLKDTEAQGEKEREASYNLRLRRAATDSCRAVLPAGTLTNVGVTANARVLEHAISKLMSSELREEQQVGLELRKQGRKITPTLIKYADWNPYLADRNPYLEGIPRRQRKLSAKLAPATTTPCASVRLLHWDPWAEQKVVAALLYRQSSRSYEEIWNQAQALSPEQRLEIIDQCLADLGPHDAPVREFEQVDYTFEFVLDYGAYREFKRHRMQSYVPQTLTVSHGFHVPKLLVDAGLEQEFGLAMDRVRDTHEQLAVLSPTVAQYVVTHAHYRRVLAKMNLRECYHLFKLRTSSQAHESIREPMQQARDRVREVHPGLFRHLRDRDQG